MILLDRVMTKVGNLLKHIRAKQSKPLASINVGSGVQFIEIENDYPWIFEK